MLEQAVPMDIESRFVSDGAMGIIGTPKTPRTSKGKQSFSSTDVSSLGTPYRNPKRFHRKPKSLSQKTLFFEPTAQSTAKKPARLCEVSPKAATTSKIYKHLRQVKINPFSPLSQELAQFKKTRRDCDSISYGSFNLGTSDSIISGLGLASDDECEESDDIIMPIKRIHFCDGGDGDNEDSRYRQEFIEIDQIGKGEYGAVFKCINKIDGCIYAVKITRKPFIEAHLAKTAINEVYAHSYLGCHSRIVRYHCAWSENGRMYIQNEYCEGGSLASLIESMASTGQSFSENQLKRMLTDIASGLKFMHSRRCAHMDIKPENIFLSKSLDAGAARQSRKKVTESSDDGFGSSSSAESMDSNDSDLDQSVVYKIGDLAFVTDIDIHVNVEEGDCRYLAPEVLNENYDHLPKADIFALGLTVYEAASKIPMPKNGELWQAMRHNQLPHLEKYSSSFNCLLRQMVHSDPEKRPTAANLLTHPFLISTSSKTKSQLRRELNQERLITQELRKKLEEVTHLLSAK